MTNEAESSRAGLRWSVYTLLIALSAGSMIGRILATNSIDRVRHERARVKAELNKTKNKLVAQGLEGNVLEDKLTRRQADLKKRLRMQRPFLSGNDRSRWLTIRALVEHGTFAIDRIVTDSEQRRVWDTIDMVKHDRWGEPHLYSSKPTLLPTILAGEYWLIHKVTGLSLADDTHTVVRIMLITINVIPLVVFFVLLARFVERHGTTDWGRLFVMATATFGTFLTTFSVALNNHLIAAVSVMIALYAAIRIWYDGQRRLRYFFIAGLFAAFAAANELPATAFFAVLGAALLLKMPRQTLIAGLPGALVVVAAALGTNYLAHRTVIPPYAHRTAGQNWQTGNWYNYSFTIPHPSGDPEKARVVDSYWKRNPENMARRSKIDRGEPSPAKYALHVLVGHHGVFSLTPVWLLSMVGVFMLLFGKDERRWRALGAMILLISLVVIAFYLTRGEENRNYGGMTSGLRWTFWLAPLWLCALLPAADWMAKSRFRKAIAIVLLVFSVLSASYPTWNPWTHPWLANLMIHLKWIEL